MTYWHLHALNARNALTGVLPEIRAAGNRANALASARAVIPPFDLVVRALPPGSGTTDLPVRGYAPRPGLVEISFVPGDFTEAEFIRALVHEMHHLMRWDGPGYGETLGEALVSEGLAGHFVLEVLGGPADPWDQVLPDAALISRALKEWTHTDYRHDEWFFGTGRLPNWAGYGLGHVLVAQHLARHPGQTAAGLAHEDAEALRATLRAMVVNGEMALKPAPIPAEPAPEIAEPEAAPRTADPAEPAQADLPLDAGQDAPPDATGTDAGNAGDQVAVGADNHADPAPDTLQAGDAGDGETGGGKDAADSLEPRP